MEAKFIRACYFDVNESLLKKSKFNEFPARPLKFGMFDKLSNMLVKPRKICCKKCKPRPKNFKKYTNGYEKIKNDLNLFKIIQTIHKMKACL